MGSRLRLDEGYHSLVLDESELSRVLEDISGIEDLVAPEIKVTGNVVHFRSEDLKIMNPEMFFKRERISLSLKEYFTNPTIGITNVVSFIILMSLAHFGMGYFKTDLTWMMALIVFVFGNILALVIHQTNEVERQRRAIYVKASLVTHFYMLVMDDMTNCNGRLSRACNQIEKEQAELHDDLDKIVNGLPADYCLRFSHLRDHKGRSIVRLDPAPKDPVKYS